MIYRTKDDIHDWEGNPVFPPRQVNEPLVIDLGPEHREWIQHIHDFYRPPYDGRRVGEARRRAAGWRCAQALQWAAFKPAGGAGLSCQASRALRLGFEQRLIEVRDGRSAALSAWPRSTSRSIVLYRRIVKEVDRQKRDADVEDIEDFVEGRADWVTSQSLEQLLLEGAHLVRNAGDGKWEIITEKLLKPAGDEKIVLFAQPIETVTSLAGFLERTTGRKSALIVGGQSDAERKREVSAFWDPDGPQISDLFAGRRRGAQYAGRATVDSS